MGQESSEDKRAMEFFFWGEGGQGSSEEKMGQGSSEGNMGQGRELTVQAAPPPPLFFLFLFPEY